MKTVIILIFSLITINYAQSELSYPIVDTGQKKFYNNNSEISQPGANESFYGEDAQYSGNEPSFTDNGNGTITDNITGLMWQKYLLNSKYDYEEVFDLADTFSLAGYDDWRVPTIKELYSLIDFSGSTGLQGINAVPYIDTDYFEFRYGDEYNPSERPIDAQYASSTIYVSTVMNEQPAMFGLNLADGRIKGYPQTKEFEVKLVRGNPNYGKNNFLDNGDGTISDLSTGLMWDREGSEEGMSWEESLEYVQKLNSENYLGYNDWRMPNAKELQSIVDYSRSPETTNSAAINPYFSVPVIQDEDGNEDYPFYWTSTTHDDGPIPDRAVYIAFGKAPGFMQFFGDNHLVLYDVHGAGAQRSDPKAGNPDDYPEGLGPQGDVIRIYNYVRPVRDIETTVGIKDTDNEPTSFNLEQNYPNPFNPSTTINFSLDAEGRTNLKIFDILGNEIITLFDENKPPGYYSINFDAPDIPSGIYFYRLCSKNKTLTKKMILIK